MSKERKFVLLHEKTDNDHQNIDIAVLSVCTVSQMLAGIASTQRDTV